MIVPNIGGFIGTGTQEAANAELHNVQLGVVAYQADNKKDDGREICFRFEQLIRR